jgi:hypothetical protein
MMFLLQSLERPPRSRRSKEEDDVGNHQEEASSHSQRRSQKPDRPHTQAGVAMQTVVLEACSPNTPRAEDWDKETREQLNRRTVVLKVLCLICVAEGKRSFL